MMKRHLNGPYEFGVSNDNIICSAKLTSASELSCGALVGTGDATYDGGGVLFPQTLSWLYQPSATERKRLLAAGHIRFELEQGLPGEGPLDKNYASGVNNTLCGWDDGSVDDFIFRINGGSNCLFNHNGNLSFFTKQRPTNYRGYIEIWISWVNDKIEFYIDGILIAEDTLPSGRDAAEFINMTIGANTVNSGSTLPTHRFRNVHIATKPIQRVVLPRFAHLNVYGDSFIKLGQYGTISGEQVILARTEDGASGSTYDSAAVNSDAGCIAVCHKELALQGIFVGRNRVHTWHQGGTGILTSTALDGRMDISLNNSYPYPTTALIFSGTNDATDGGIALADITGGSWRTAYETEIAKLTAVGCKVVICTVPPAQAQTGNDTDTVKDKQHAMNSEVADIVAADSDVSMCDVFTMYGGDNFDPTDFGAWAGTSNDRHPSQKGHHKLGSVFAQSLARLA